ncbi:MAG: hypothetical protein AcusKO_08350 [Acuticoccus sp.]
MARRIRTSDQAAPRKRDAERTRARLLAVAVNEFAAHGFEGARVERVVRAANVTPRMLYHYFGNKEQLCVCVLDEVYAQIRAGERQLDLGTGDPVEALRRLVAYTFDFFQDNETFVQLTRAEVMVVEALRGAVIITSMIIVIMASSTLFSQLLAISGASGALTEWVTGLGLSPVMMLLAMMLLVFAFCMFVDQVAVMLVVIPIYLPIVGVLGFDPLWFWLLMLLNVTVGGITPPFGYAMFAFKGAADVPMNELFAAAWPFVGLFILGMVIVGLVPPLATFLPSLL